MAPIGEISENGWPSVWTERYRIIQCSYPPPPTSTTNLTLLLSDGNFLAVGSHDNFVYIYAVMENGKKYSRVGKCTVSKKGNPFNGKLNPSIFWTITLTFLCFLYFFSSVGSLQFCHPPGLVRRQPIHCNQLRRLRDPILWASFVQTDNSVYNCSLCSVVVHSSSSSVSGKGEASSGKHVTSMDLVRNVEWATSTCVLGFSVFGELPLPVWGNDGKSKKRNLYASTVTHWVLYSQFRSL